MVKANPNPILDTRVYEVEFPNGRTAEYAANVIAENLYAMCDPEGIQQQLMDSIIGHESDSTAVTEQDRYVTIGGDHYRGKKYPHITTKGWKLCVKWDDGSTSWVRLADLKELYPAQLAKYAVANDIADKPAFAWWVPYVLKNQTRILSKVKSRYHKTTHKFGFEVPNTVKRALEIDEENGNHLWRDMIALEMESVCVMFKILEEDQNPPPGHSYMEGHIIFDVKMENFRRKARYVAGGHQIDTPAIMTYASVVSRESVRIALTIAALNDLDAKTSDVKNAFLTAPCDEKVWTTLGPDEGKKAIIVRALYLSLIHI